MKTNRTKKDEEATVQKKHSTAKDRQYKFYVRLIWVFSFLIASLILLFIVYSIVNKAQHFDIKKVLEVCSILIPLFTAVFSWLFGIKTNLKNKIEEEEHQRKIFFSEFKDMTRHLKANLRILIKLRFEIAKPENKRMKPASIHFENLKLPTDSAIFSDRILLLIDRNIVDDITRMQIKLRNMNNSAEWLKSLVEKKNYSASSMKKALDWEIYRTITYLVNACYMKENEYHFATEEQLAAYLESQPIQNELSLLFKGVVPPEYRKRMAAEYIRMYHEDREKSRKVILVPSGNIL